VGLGETRSPRYSALGLLAVDNAQGLALLEQCLGIPEPVVLPLLVDPSRFDAQALTRLRPEAPAAARSAEAAPAAAPTPAATPAPTPAPAPKPATKPTGVDQASLIEALRLELAPVLRVEPQEWPAGAAFESLGVDSVLIASINRALESWLGESLDPGMLLEYPSLEALAGNLLAEHGAAITKVLGAAEASAEEPAAAEPPAPESRPVPPTPQYVRQAPIPEPAAPPPSPPPAPSGGSAREGFAVIGMACRFPQSPNLASFEANLKQGFDGIREVPASRWEIDRWYHPGEYRQGKSISKWGGFVDDVELFDPEPFDLDEAVAPHVDPILRLALETGIEALRDAGYDKEQVYGRPVAVFMGSRVANYADRIPKYEKNSVVATGQVFFAAHLAHVLNLKGPAMVVDSACSSSLLSIHQACRSLADDEAQMALAGGVDILLDERPYLMLSEARALSPTGRCRTFDESADGFVPGEGCGVIVLKRLSKALADGDRIYALIEGSAINNDGRTMGITTPNPEQQQAVIRAAWQRAGADPASIGYMETHGTGTRIGDPIELKALTAVLGGATRERRYCAIGTVKSNFGHLLSAAGVAAFMKTALCIHGETLVPTLHCRTPNPRFAFADSPFYPNDRLRPWEPRQGVRRAGVTALGFGGTNVHLVVSDAHRQRADYAPSRQALGPVEYDRRRFWLAAPAGGSAGVPQTHTAAAPPALPQSIAGYRFSKRY
jgi:3-oxoacyl-(acyl-carrier-protein) synthase